MECGNGKENMLRRESIEKRMKRRAGKAGRFFMLLLVSASLGGCKPKSQEPQWLDENAHFTGESAMDNGQIPEGTTPEAASAAGGSTFVRLFAGKGYITADRYGTGDGGRTEGIVCACVWGSGKSRSVCSAGGKPCGGCSDGSRRCFDRSLRGSAPTRHWQ